MKVLFTPEVDDYLDELETLLYKKGYFSFEESASEYVHELIHDIRAALSARLHRPAPPHFDPDDEGVWMASFRRSRATTWYAFFTKYNDGSTTVYLVQRIENNHTAAQYM